MLKRKVNSGCFKKGKNHPYFGKHLSIRHKKRISNSNKGKLLSLEHRKNLSISHLNSKYKPKSNLFSALDEEEIIKLYIIKNFSAIKIAKLFRCDKGAIYGVLKRNNKKIRKSVDVLRNKFFGKTFEQIYGNSKALILKNKLHKRFSGSNNHQWKGGISFENYPQEFNKLFKKSIRDRDNQICMNCGKHREKLARALNVHHIDYNKFNSIKENCISLCDICHGFTVINREYWKKLFQDKLGKLYNYKYTKEGDILIKI